MEILTLEFALWMLLAFFVGCILGYLLRTLFLPVPTGSEQMYKGELDWSATPVERAGTQAPPYRGAGGAQAPLAVPSAQLNSDKKTELQSVSPPTEQPPRVDEPVALEASVRPLGLAEPRGGKADNLQQITGIGPKLEKTLHSLGFYHFDQIAAWTKGEVAWVDAHLRFKGRIERERWLSQAGRLAAKTTGEVAGPNTR